MQVCNIMSEKLLYDIVQLWEWPEEETKVRAGISHCHCLDSVYFVINGEILIG